ncbi:MAG TPA: FHA domain-containing protein [Actinomycetota bacterium]|nr:FHA domain-containing protein [Actinomycetota bacterium]
MERCRGPYDQRPVHKPEKRGKTIAIVLIIRTGTGAGRRIEVEGPMTIGREAADITIEDPEISRRHAEVRPAGGGLEVEDLGSTNGTFINEDRIGSATALAGGDTLRVGQAELQLESAPVAGGTVVAGAPAGGTAISQSPSPQEPSAPSGAATQAWQPAPEAETPTAAQPAAGYTPPPASSQPPSEYTPPPAPLRPEGGGYSPPQGGYTPPPAQGAAYTPPPAQQGYSPPQAQQPYQSGAPSYQSGPPSYGGAPASKSGGSKTPLIIGLVVALLAITAIVLFVFPGVLKTSDEDTVREAVESFGQVIDDPEAFCDLFTQRFLEEQAGTTGDAARDACIEDVETTGEEPVEIQITSVDVQGDNATVEAEAEGETGTFQLENQDGEWLIDSVE